MKDKQKLDIYNTILRYLISTHYWTDYPSDDSQLAKLKAEAMCLATMVIKIAEEQY